MVDIPELTPVKSSNVHSAKHHSDGHLYVRFHNGTVGRYLNVPASVAAEMAASDSVGRYLHEVVKPGFAWERLE